MAEYSAEVRRQLNYLASNPNGYTTMTNEDIQNVLLTSGGNILACGRLYDYVVTPIGVGVSKVTLKLTHP